MLHVRIPLHLGHVLVWPEDVFITFFKFFCQRLVHRDTHLALVGIERLTGCSGLVVHQQGLQFGQFPGRFIGQIVLLCWVYRKVI